MIVGLGIDLVELRRVKRSLERFEAHFCRKLLHEEEMAFMPALTASPSPRLVEWTAGRFAAKEAAFKALGTGLAGGMHFHDIRIRPDAAGRPQLFLHGKAAERAHFLEAAMTHISLTHTASTAAAVVILSR